VLEPVAPVGGRYLVNS